MQLDGKFMTHEGRLVWRETRTFPLSDTGCIFVAHKPNTDAHQIYKLQRQHNADSSGRNEYVWCGLWNTCVVAGSHVVKNKKSCLFPTIEDAVQNLLDNGWTVRQIILPDLPAFMAEIGLKEQKQ